MSDTATLTEPIIEQDDDEIDDDLPSGSEPMIKQYTGEICKDAGTDARAFIATITTNSIDRDREVVLPKGINFDRYMKNPLVFFGHESWKMPIGKTVWIKSRGNTLVAKAVPAPTDQAQDVFKMIDGGFLKAVSIGFDPSPYADQNGPPTEKELRAKPEWASVRRVWRKVDLLEWSVVGIPSNPDALIEAVEKGLLLSDETRDRMGIRTTRIVEKKPEPIIKPVPTPAEQIAESMIEVKVKERSEPVVSVRRIIMLKEHPRQFRPGPRTVQSLAIERARKLTGFWQENQ